MGQRVHIEGASATRQTCRGPSEAVAYPLRGRTGVENGAISAVDH